MVKVGIIGGSGFDDPNLLRNALEETISTRYGDATITSGKINDVEVFVIARHGKKHDVPPHKVNYRANIEALKNAGCTYIIATSAVGSLREEIRPGDIVFPDQIIDFTKSRVNTLYDDVGEVKHEAFSEPFSTALRQVLIETANSMRLDNHETGTMIVVEGPRFSTRAESNMFRLLGADIIGMTAMPECAIAKEAGLHYASIAMSTDYDCWKNDEKPVTFDMVKQRMKENADKVKSLIIKVLERLENGMQEADDGVEDVCEELDNPIEE